MSTISKFILNHSKLVLSLFSTTVVITVFIFALFQIDQGEETIYNITYSFTKLSGKSISQLISKTEYKDIINTNDYVAYSPKEYKQYENPDIFVITTEYLKLMEQNGMTKYKTAYIYNNQLSDKINDVVNSFLVLNFVQTAYVIDKSGYIPYVADNYKNTIKGVIGIDKGNNIIHNIFPDMTAGFIQKNHVSDNLYHIKETNMYYTCYPIMLNDKIWAHIVVIYDNKYFKEYKNSYIQKATILCIIVILLFGLIIKGAKL